MIIRLIAFTDKGFALAQQLARELYGEASRCSQGCTLKGWTEDAFQNADGLIFVGAAGIAVRAIAPYVTSKASDPAVIVLDECAHFAVPILSGHLGGANDLARRISALCGAVPVITTATDANGVFAVDEWAKRQGCAVINPEKIKRVSGKILSGETTALYSSWPVGGEIPQGVAVTGTPEGCDFVLTMKKTEPRNALLLVPRIAVLGIGCRKGTPVEAIEAAFQALMEQHGIFSEMVSLAATIDLKKEEPGVLAFCASRDIPLQVFSAKELQAVEGDFSASAFVERVTGVDNVCERSAMAACGTGGKLIIQKTAGNGITMALAIKPFFPDWRWQYE